MSPSKGTPFGLPQHGASHSVSVDGGGTEMVVGIVLDALLNSRGTVSESGIFDVSRACGAVVTTELFDGAIDPVRAESVCSEITGFDAVGVRFEGLVFPVKFELTEVDAIVVYPEVYDDATVEFAVTAGSFGFEFLEIYSIEVRSL